MKIQAHDAHYSFDYVAFVNAVFDAYMDKFGMTKFIDYQWGITPAVMGKFFRYRSVSLPTLLKIEFGSGVRMMDFVIKID